MTPDDERLLAEERAAIQEEANGSYASAAAALLPWDEEEEDVHQELANTDAAVVRMEEYEKKSLALDRLTKAREQAAEAQDELAEAEHLAAEVSAEQAQPLLSISLYELGSNPPPAPEFIVEPLFTRASTNVTVGKAYGGKSLKKLQLGLYGAAGLKFLDTFTFPRPLRVLYIDEEMGVNLLWARAQKMIAGRPEFHEADVLKRFRIVSRKGLRLDQKKGLDAIRRELGEFPDGPPDLTFMDTFRRMHRREEKDSGEMALLMDTCLSIVDEFKTALDLIHHSKKGPNEEEGDWREAARGSGDIVANTQSIVGLWKTGELLFSMRADVKAAGEIAPFPMILDGATLLYRRQSDEERSATKAERKAGALADARADIHKLIRKMKDDEDWPPSKTYIVASIPRNDKTVAAALDAMVVDGELLKVERKKRGGGYGYVPPETPAGTPVGEIEKG